MHGESILERLESRICLAATLSAGVLTITGTEGSDVIEVDLRDTTTLRVEINDRNPLLKGAEIFAGRGHDTVEGAQARDAIPAGSGNDDFDNSDAATEIIDRLPEDKGPNLLL
jgi:hypothetical protein